MTIDADRLIQIAGELKSLDHRREGLLAELGRLAQGVGGTGAVSRPGPGRPPGSRNHATPAAASPNPSAARGRKRRSGITADILAFLKSGRGGAYTAGEILEGLKLPKSQGLATTISTTLVRLAKEGRAKKDKERGYRAA